MTRPFLLIAILLISTHVFSQTIQDLQITKELNLVYSDTVNGKTYLGNYEPTGAISCNDSSYIISTIFSIDFPEQYDTTYLRTDFAKYYERSKLYSAKAHVSSGSVLKLNKDFNKIWEVTFKDKRVTHIISFDSSSFIIAGERIDLNVIWIAKINSNNANIIWMKEFKVGRSLSTCGLTYANGNFYILGETERIIPLKIQKDYGRTRIELFKESDMQSSLILLCVSKNGSLNWKKKIDPKRNYNYFGYNFISTNENHFILSSFTGFNKVKKKWVKDEALAFYTLNKKGKIKSKEVVDFNDMLYFDTSIVFTKTNLGSDTIKIYKLTNLGVDRTDSFSIFSERKDIRIESVLNTSKNYYLYGSMQVNNKDYLICSMTKDYQITECRKHDQPDYNNLVSLMETHDKELLIIGWCYKRNEQTGKLYKYMNLIKFKKFGT
ncbi:hypothetical protein FRZ67_08065 [Panacibacter ginsenosidivorans]|uniref:Exo-alpha-sialidase n=1 Tax=Panacibacter ginsenosidivorans TaxID=1813871 RepID=A0A5B8V8T1_9BACT|nr:hypothetical protein [Panacibacter ginsenosidivorans]QEC67251.1 hypothetical protein FRZ67_08065 [Panacibacter ginsenosidivorans]